MIKKRQYIDRYGETRFPKTCFIANIEVPTAVLLNLLVESSECCPEDHEKVSVVLMTTVQLWCADC